MSMENGQTPPDGSAVTKVIELPSLQPITNMVKTGQQQCVINNVIIQNGLTTNQVGIIIIMITIT